MNTAALGKLIAARNREIMMEVALSFVLGVVFVIVTAGFLFWITWLISYRWGGWGATPVGAGLIAVGVYLLVATLAAWRGVNPFGAIEYDENYAGSSNAGLSMMTGIPIFDRHGIAAAGAALIAGPANILDAIADIRRRLPHDRITVESAAHILEQSAREMRLDEGTDYRALWVLHRLALIKSRSIEGNVVVVATAKGFDVLNGR